LSNVAFATGGSPVGTGSPIRTTALGLGPEFNSRSIGCVENRKIPGFKVTVVDRTE
jgi:hypothetical protein